MQYSTFTSPLPQKSCDCLVVGFYETDLLSDAAQSIDQACQGLITRIIQRDKKTGKTGETILLNYVPDIDAERVLFVGLGKKDHTSGKDYRKAISCAIKVLKSCAADSVAIAFTDTLVEGKDLLWKSRQIAELSTSLMYKFTALKSDKEENPGLSQLEIFVTQQSDITPTEIGLKQGQAIGQGMNLAKDLADLPGNVCTPTYLAEQAIALSQDQSSISVQILEEADMQELGMGALLSVSKGSRQPAKMIIMEYWGAPKQTKPIVLVGKGLTFDAGGISLKSAGGMDEMKYDMCGGASVIGTMLVVSALELPLNVIGVVASSENLPDGNANKPGDIVKSMSGKTIEILNTDAEGRLILCDALTYVERYDPEYVVDMATLTGACIVALGRHPSGLLGNDDELCEALIKAGETAGDRLWRLPLWEDYQEQLKSNFADMANIGGPDGGTITAGCFLSRYTEKYKWAHLDIAGTAWKSGKQKGATGRPVPLLSQFLLDQVDT